MLPDLLEVDGLQLRRSGSTKWLTHCPFHEERTPSFTVWEDHAHCYGCGWHGGALKYVMDSRKIDRDLALEMLLAHGMTPRPTRPHLHQRNEKPRLPALFNLNQDGMNALAKLRCLSHAGIRLAVEAGRVFGTRWLGHQAWVVTDARRLVAQARRFDGAMFRIGDRDIKCWTFGSPSWALGAAELERARTPKVVLVEGGPDMLAAYDFLATQWKISGRYVSPEFTPVAMLGASCKISDEALPYFDRKRVRIMRHNDAAGLAAAARWTEQLSLAGAAVETCSLSSLSSKADLKAALFDFDF